MTPHSIAVMLADYLRDRDDIASADAIVESDGSVSVGIETQGGELFVAAITPA